ncbi:MAG: gliding motility-associated C-terminal domain-containing protein [Bacteroidetes bacterium]|nr:gliding motility-associated C-terminal domain-containing protein [Bacteroidota bacterium]
MRKSYFFKILVLVFLAFGVIPASAQNGMAGKEFWVGFLSSYYNSVDIILNISSNHNTSGTVSIPLQNWDTTFSVNAGGMASILLPAQVVQNSTSEVSRNNGVFISSAENITVFAANHSMYSTDASYVLPLNMLQADYFAVSYTAYGQAPSDALIVATQNNTIIEITPSINTFWGKPAGIPFSITLNRGQTYLLRSESGGDLSGTQIAGKGQFKPFAVFSGVYITNIPSGNCCADHLFQQMLPVDYWGLEYLVAPVKGNFAIRIVASEANTEVKINNGGPILLNKGQYFTAHHLNTPQYISSNKAITVAQYLQSSDSGGAGDPAMTIISPVKRGICSANFSTLQVSTVNEHYLNIITKTTVNNKVYLNGNDISLGFIPFLIAPDYSHKLILINHGTYNLTADSGFIANVFGIGNIDSYFYSLGIGGGYYEPIVDFNVSQPACTGQAIDFSVNQIAHSYQWLLGDGNSATGSKISYIYDKPGSYKISLIINSPEGYCETLYTDTIEKIIEVHELPNYSMFTDTTLCGKYSSININLPGSANKFLWSTGDTSSSVTIENAGNYWVLASNQGCSRRDTFKIKKLNYPKIELFADKKSICPFETAHLNTHSNAGLNFKWTTGETTKNIIANQEGMYGVEGSNECGTAKDSIHINALVNPSVNISNDTTILLGTFTPLQATGGISYSWHPPTGLSCTNCPNPIAAPEQTTLYYVTSTGENGCKTMDSVMVIVDIDLHIYIPNIFSPNGDGQNDVLYVRGKGIKNLQFFIYNRWGEMVFESRDLNYGWDGTFRGQLLAPGVFVYSIVAILETGQRVVKNGDVTLIK